ncbi:MAG: O-antigen ligase family protein [Solirubrobacterales bacterium]
MAAHRSARRRLYLAVIALSAMVGAVCAGFNSGLGPFPPNGEENGLEIATAATHVMIDTPASSPPLALSRALPQDVETSVKHAEMLGRVAVSPPVLESVALICQVSPDGVSGLARTTANVPLAFAEPDSERRASEIQGSRSRYRLEVQGRPLTPIVGAPTPVFDVYTQAPSAGQAECLADAVVVGLRGYLRTLPAEDGDEANQIRLHQIGAARGVVVNQGAPLMIAGLTLLSVFALTCALLLGLVHLLDRRSAVNTAARTELLPPSNGVPDGERRSSGRLDLLRSRLGARHQRTPVDDHWPRTRRVLPWTLAGFIALIWLVPFNTLALNVSLPIDLSLDRIVLPVVAISWALALLARSAVAPRLRLTWIHAALGVFLIIALLSVVLDARYLNQTLELELSLKKLPLLVSYVSLFVITASAVRRKEVPAFLSYTLLLAVVCALGMIYEYRTEQNLFWNLSDSLLPGAFTLGGQLDPGALDSIGRRIVRGPGETPLEAVAMLTLALPIALVRLIDAVSWGKRIMYALAACLLVAAVFATYRKSALVVPAAVVLTLVYFRRSALLKLAPLGLVVLVIAMVLSPGALSSIADQFTRSDRAAVGTVSDRASDYDAIRPDVWSHLALGRGWGSYNHDSYRILDSEVLHRTIETGVLGLVAFLLIPLVVLAVARGAIVSRDHTAASVGLVGAAIAVVFFVLALMFDVLSFPHVPYVFLYMTGLVAVVILERREDKTAHRGAAPGAVGRADSRDPARRSAKDSLVAMR